MNSIKTYVEGKSLKVFFIISYQGKRFQVYTGITSTVKFSGMIFPKSVPNARAKTAMLARLFASVEEYVYMNGDLPVARMKEEIKVSSTEGLRRQRRISSTTSMSSSRPR